MIPDYCIEYANALACRAQVTMVCSNHSFAGHADMLEPSVSLKPIEWPRHRSPGNLTFIQRLIRMIRDARPDVVHIMSEGVIWLNLLVPFAKAYGLVTTVHDVTYHPGDHASRRVPRRLVDWLITRSDQVIVHGPGLRAEAERRYPVMKGRVQVLPHMPIQRYSTIARNMGLSRDAGSTVNVLFFGRIYAYKGLDVLIRSIPMVRSRFADIRVVIAGKGDDMDHYRDLMVEPAVFDFRNRYIPDDETARLFTDADIVVLPYIEASQSGVLAIANAFGKCAIVTDVGELGHSVEDGVSGLVIPPRDEMALADAIVRLANDKLLRDRMGEQGRLAAARIASAEKVAETAVEIYQLASKRKNSGRVPRTERQPRPTGA
jgi:glycosyltransferase involved in cell wall biosynthesis